LMKMVHGKLKKRRLDNRAESTFSKQQKSQFV